MKITVRPVCGSDDVFPNKIEDEETVDCEFAADHEVRLVLNRPFPLDAVPNETAGVVPVLSRSGLSFVLFGYTRVGVVASSAIDVRVFVIDGLVELTHRVEPETRAAMVSDKALVPLSAVPRAWICCEMRQSRASRIARTEAIWDKWTQATEQT